MSRLSQAIMHALLVTQKMLWKLIHDNSTTTGMLYTVFFSERAKLFYALCFLRMNVSDYQSFKCYICGK